MQHKCGAEEVMREMAQFLSKWRVLTEEEKWKFIRLLDDCDLQVEQRVPYAAPRSPRKDVS